MLSVVDSHVVFYRLSECFPASLPNPSKRTDPYLNVVFVLFLAINKSRTMHPPFSKDVPHI